MTHSLLSRHLYLPMIKQHYSRRLAGAAVFLLSALFHEYLVSVPLRMFKLWSFIGMMMQVTSFQIKLINQTLLQMIL